MKKTMLLTVLFCFLLIGTALAKNIVVKGSGSSRENALHDAFRNAVEQAIGVYTTSETQVVNYQVKKDEILAKSQGFVMDYKILSERTTGHGVELEVNVNVNDEPNSALVNALKLVPMTQNPRISVIIPELHLRRFIVDPAGETAVINTLINGGFSRVVDQQQVNRIREKNMVLAAIKGDRSGLLHEIATWGTDYVVLGEAFSQDAANLENSGVYSARARLEAKIIRVSTGEILGANGFYGTGIDVTPEIAGKKALEKAGIKMGEFVISKFLNNGSSSVKGLQVIASNISNYEDVNNLIKAMRAITGIQNVYTRDYASGTAKFDIDFSGTPQMFLEGLKKEYPGSINVQESSMGVIKISV